MAHIIEKILRLSCKKDGVPISGAAFEAYNRDVYYAMAVTDFSSTAVPGAGYFLQLEVMKALKEKGYERYVVGLLAKPDASEKLQHISRFKEKLGERYIIEGEAFPFVSYIPVTKSDAE